MIEPRTSTGPAAEAPTAPRPTPLPSTPVGYSGRSVSVFTLGLTSSLLPVLGVVPGLVAVAMARGARKQIRRSEGMLRGESLLRAGLWLAWSGILSAALLIWATIWGVQWLISTPQFHQALSAWSSLQQLSHLTVAGTTPLSTFGGLPSLENLGNLAALAGEPTSASTTPTAAMEAGPSMSGSMSDQITYLDSLLNSLNGRGGK